MVNEFFRKLLFSDLNNEPLNHRVLNHQIQNASDIWNNKAGVVSNAIGVERILKLILIVSQFIFPGIYVRAIFGYYGKLYKHLGVEIHVFLKLFCSSLFLYFELYNSNYNIVISIIEFWSYWMIFETVFYTANLVFSEDVFAKPHSHKRNLILIVIDYITLNIDFANLYLVNKAIKQINGNTIQIITNVLDGIYFSFITSLTIGYGDITPTDDGKKLVVFQTMVMLLFGILFLNFYISRASKNA